MAVLGATGRIGGYTMEAPKRSGHEGPLSRATGVDAYTGAGLDQALAGEVLLPGDGARLGRVRFDDGLATGAR